MSRTLSKILVICAMVVVLPLMIVGTAFAAYHSVGNAVGVEVVVDQASPASNVYIAYKGERKSSHKISEGHTKVVDVVADNSPAYTFKGWFEGTAADYKNGAAKEISKEHGLKISMEEAKNYVAVYEVVKYNIAFSYQKDPRQEALTTDAATQYIYGQTLKTKADISSYAGEEYQFNGWQIDGATPVQTGYTTAAFAGVESGSDVTLVSPWVESKKVTLTIDNNGTSTEKEVYANQAVSVEDIVKELGITVETGYEFSLRDTATGLEYKTTLSAAANMNLKLVGPTAIEYTAQASKLSFNAAEFAEGVTANDVSFTVTNVDGFNAWLNLKTKYSFWKVSGISYKGTTYTAENLTDLATAYAKDSTGNFALVVAKNFSTVVVENGIEYLSTESEIGIAFENNVYVTSQADPYKVVDKQESKNLQNMTVAQWLMIDAEYLEGEQLYTIVDGEKWTVRLKQIVIEVGSSKIKIETTENESMLDFLQKYHQEAGVSAAETLSITKLVVCFVPYEKIEL